MSLDHLESPALSARTQGAGELVVCLHASAASHTQWHGLAQALSARWQVLTPDLHGHGASPAWPAQAPNRLLVDAQAVLALVNAATARAATPATAPGMHLVGHSYGAAVALQIALRVPEQVRSLTLYEPVTFGVLQEMAPRDPALMEILDITHSVRGLVQRGALDEAAQAFIHYWSGADCWNELAPQQRDAIARRMPPVPRHFDACFAARWQRSALDRLNMPILLMNGEHTRTPSRRVVELLAHALPHAVRRELPGAGHLGPMTHAATVNDWMATRIDPSLVSGLARVALKS